jgi:streptogramin lyase
MKKLFTKVNCFIIVALLSLVTSISANAQVIFKGTNLETGGLYTALAKDASNNLYVTRVQTGTSGATYQVVKYTGGTGTPVSIYSGLTHELDDFPWGLVVSSTGDVYLSTDFTTGGGSITKLTYNSATNTYTPSTFQTGNYYSALAMDAANNLYTCEYDVTHSTYDVMEYAAGSAASAPGTNLYDNLKQGAGYAYPTGLTVAANGDIYVADAFSNIPTITDGGRVIKLTKASSYAASVISTGNYSASLTLDASGNLFSTENRGSGYQLIEYVGGTGAGTAVYSPLHANGFYYPWGIVSISAASMFVVDGDDGINGGAVVHLTPAPPMVITNPVSFPTTTGATLNGVSNDNGYTTTVNFIYGTAANLAGGTTTVATTGGSIAVGGGTTAAALTLNGLTPATTYYYRISSTNTNGTTNGAMLSFTTLNTPAISYVSPDNYTTGVPIESMSPANTGGSIPGNYYGQVSTYAGNGTPGNTNGPVATATFNSPYAETLDLFGNMYVADYGNNSVRLISAGVVSTFAGSGAAGSANGTGTAATFRNPTGIVADASGNVYVSDGANNEIRKITPAGVVTTFAGSTTAGSANGTGSAARFSSPHGLAIDAAGNIYVADYNNNLIREISPTGVVTTFAGSGTAGAVNGTGTAASFNKPYGLSVDASGNVYVADFGNNLVRKITSTGVVTTLAGSGAAGNTNGTGTAASFHNILSTVEDAAGDVYVSEGYNDDIRMITPAGVVTNLAGSGAAGNINGTGTAAQFSSPHGLAMDASGNIYVADAVNNEIRLVTSTGYTLNSVLPAGLTLNGLTGIISGTPTAASAAANYSVTAYNTGGGSTATINIKVANPAAAPVISYANSTHTYITGKAIEAFGITNTGGAVPATSYSLVSTFAGSGTIGATNGTGTAASFHSPSGVAIDASGNVYVADYNNNLIREISPAGVVTTFAGSGAAGAVNGTGTAASFNKPYGVAVDVKGNVYVADGGNNLIRKITATGVVTTFAGTGGLGYVDGAATVAKFRKPVGVAVDGQGNVYVGDNGNNVIREINSSGTVSTLAGSGTAGSADGTGIAASFFNPWGLSVDASGNIYVADNGNNNIRKITPAGVVTTLAGSGVAGNSTGTGTMASFSSPYSTTVDNLGNVYVADGANNQVKMITPAGVVTNLAGSGTTGTTNAIGTAARFNNPHGVAIDTSGNLYVADYGSSLIRKIITQGYIINSVLPTGLAFDGTTGIISGTPTVASTTTNYTVSAYNSGGSSSATVAITVNSLPPAPVISYPTSLTYTTGIPVEPLSATNTGGPVPATAYGLTSTLAGSGMAGSANGTGTAASFHNPSGVALDAAGNVYVADETNNVIRKIAPGGITTTFAGSGTGGNVNGTGTAASFKNPLGVAVDAAGNIYVADASNNLIRKITPAGIVTTFAGSGTAGSANGTGTFAQFNNPHGITVDPVGNIFVADYTNNLIREISPAGVVTTFAGSGTAGATNGTGTAASFKNPFGLSADISGNLYVADYGNNLIRKITPAGVVTTLAGSGVAGKANGIGTAASFNNPLGTTVDASGNVYVADAANDLIRIISPAGAVTTLAGTGTAGAINGAGNVASFYSPHGLAVDASGDLYVGDAANNLVRQVQTTGYTINVALPAGLSFDSSTGTITGTPTKITAAKNYVVTAYNTGGSSRSTINIIVNSPVEAPKTTYAAGTHTYQPGTLITPLSPINKGGAVPTNIYAQVSTLAGSSGTSGSANGTGTAATFYFPYGTAVDASGNVYVADYGNDLIRKITPAGVVSTLAGTTGVAGSTDGTGTAASFNAPFDVATDAAGNVYVTDGGNNTIRKITPAGVVTTIAGTVGVAGSADGTGTAASFSQPRGITVDGLGNIFVVDANNYTIRKITPAGVVTTIAGTVGVAGSANGTGTAASFNSSYGIAADQSIRW